MNNLTRFLIAAALADIYLNYDRGEFTEAQFLRLVAAAIESLPEDDYLRERLIDYLQDTYELSDALENYMIAIARDENLSPYFGGTNKD